MVRQYEYFRSHCGFGFNGKLQPRTLIDYVETIRTCSPMPDMHWSARITRPPGRACDYEHRPHRMRSTSARLDGRLQRVRGRGDAALRDMQPQVPDRRRSSDFAAIYDSAARTV